jgi:hypothetical protein
MSSETLSTHSILPATENRQAQAHIRDRTRLSFTLNAASDGHGKNKEFIEASSPDSITALHRRRS